MAIVPRLRIHHWDVDCYSLEGLGRRSGISKTKECTCCKETIPLNWFYKQASGVHGRQSQCKQCLYEKNQKRISQYSPWQKTYYSIRRRCNTKHPVAYKWYKAKGIKCLITKDELRKLWFRDNGSSMKDPTIDRIDPDGHYEYSNCQYVENAVNASNAWKARKAKNNEPGE